MNIPHTWRIYLEDEEKEIYHWDIIQEIKSEKEVKRFIKSFLKNYKYVVVRKNSNGELTAMESTKLKEIILVERIK